MKYFIVENDVIVNAILAETKGIAEQVTGLKAIKATDSSVKNAGRGFIYNPATKKYEAPETE